MKKTTVLLSMVFFSLVCFSQEAEKSFSSFEQARQHPVIHEDPAPDFFEGAFLISARRIIGKTQYVRIKSMAGEPCSVIPGLEGEEAILLTGKHMPVLTMAPIPEKGQMQ
jgi:hypothetical protein